MSTAGLLLAAGAGRRFGGPKALARDDDGTAWVRRRAGTLLDGGCDPVLVVTGARAREVAAELAGTPVLVVEAPHWEEGMGASLRSGLEALGSLDPAPAAVLVALVDTPGLTAEVVARLAHGADRSSLAQACYRGTPGHPVLIGRDHWSGVREVSTGDRGARDYLRARDVRLVECGDVGTGEDVDRAPPTLTG